MYPAYERLTGRRPNASLPWLVHLHAEPAGLMSYTQRPAHGANRPCVPVKVLSLRRSLLARLNWSAWA
jgi:hypothetical protein